MIDHTINISRHNPLAGRSWIELPKKLNHPEKGLINVQNIDDNEFFKWCLFRYVHDADHHPRRIRGTEKLFGDKSEFEDIKRLVKIKDIYKVEKKNSIRISVVSHESKEKCPIYVSKNALKKNILIYY